MTTDDRVKGYSQKGSRGKRNSSDLEDFNKKKKVYDSDDDLVIDDPYKHKKMKKAFNAKPKPKTRPPQSDSDNDLVQNPTIVAKNMETFGQYTLKFTPQNRLATPKAQPKPETHQEPIKEKTESKKEEEEILIDSNDSENKIGKDTDPSQDDFMSFGHSVSTQKVYNNLAKMFTQLENSIKNPILLSALVVIESESILVTGGSNDRTLRFWSILAQENGYTLQSEHEMKVFNKSITNVKYIERKQLILAGDSQLLIMFDMTDFFENKSVQPRKVEVLKNSHWLRCIYHYYTNSKDWLITAKNNSLFYFDLDSMKTITPRINPDKFDENIMCFEQINDSTVLVGNGKSISFLSIRDGKRVGESRRDHDKLINNILYVKKRKYVLSGGDDGFIFLYRLNMKKLNLHIMQKVSPSGSTPKSFIDSLVYFEEQSMLFCTNRTKSLTIFCFNRNNLLKEKSKITELKFKVTGLYFWKKQVSLLAYSSLVPNIIILGFAGVNINN